MKPWILLPLLCALLCGGVGLALLLGPGEAVDGGALEPEFTPPVPDPAPADMEAPDPFHGLSSDLLRRAVPGAESAAEITPPTAGSESPEFPDGPPPDPVPPEARVLDVVEGEVQRARYGNGQLWYVGHQVAGPDGTLVREGSWEAWHENGALHELGAYKSDVEHGPWKWWYESGALQAQGTFEEGKREGRWDYWYENGNKMMESEYRAGATVGWWTYYHENGRKRAEGEYVNGAFEGPWTVWFEDGRVDDEGTGTYRNGVKVGS